jgi:adenosylmethionine-8-amino-7-oxononanoate aminotransferase
MMLFTMLVSHISMFYYLYNVQLYMQGSYVYDNNGNKYLDSLAGLWCTALGMCKYSRRIVHSLG